MTRFTRCALCQLLPILLAVCSGGCGDGGDGARVDGTVTLDGANIEKGSISFFPQGGEAKGAGGTIVNGKYSVKGLGTGKYRVHIDIPSGNKKPTQEERAHPTAAPPPAKIEGNDQEVEIAPGSQQKDIQLQKGAQ